MRKREICTCNGTLLPTGVARVQCALGLDSLLLWVVLIGRQGYTGHNSLLRKGNRNSSRNGAPQGFSHMARADGTSLVSQYCHSNAAMREALVRRSEQGGLPNHLAIVMDGNRRWARQHYLPSLSRSHPSPPFLLTLPSPAASVVVARRVAERYGKRGAHKVSRCTRQRCGCLAQEASGSKEATHKAASAVVQTSNPHINTIGNVQRSMIRSQGVLLWLGWVCGVLLLPPPLVPCSRDVTF